MGKIYFLSHSSDDNTIVQTVANQLGIHDCWLYEWEIKPGDTIFEYDRGIADSRVFVLFWSKNAKGSKFVEDEVSQARIRLSRDSGFRLITVRLDDTPLPTWLEYRSWIDGSKGIHDVVRPLSNLKLDLTPEETYFGAPVLRDIFQNRENELNRLEQIAFSGESPVLILGMNGIGKTSLVKRALAVLFSHLTPVWINLDDVITPLRLLSLLSRPLSIRVEQHIASTEPEEMWSKLLFPEIKESRKILVVLDNIQVPTAIGYTRSDNIMKLLEKICYDLAQVHKPNNPGIIATSWTEPNFNPGVLKCFKKMELGSLSDKSIARVLRYSLSRASSIDYDSNKLEKVSMYIGGYPAAIGALVQKIQQKGVDAVLSETEEIKKLRYLVAEEVFSRVTFSGQEKLLLILLAISGQPLTEQQLRYILGDKWSDIETIKKKQILDPTSYGYSLHNILKDYITESIGLPKDILDAHGQLSRLFDMQWKRSIPMSAQRAEFASLCHYHTFASGSIRRAKLIEADFLDEAKAAGIELYRRGQYKNASAYFSSVRNISTKSDPICDFYYGLSLNRLDRHDEALKIIQDLVRQFPRVARYYHAQGTIYRNLEKIPEALDSFRQAVALSTGRGRSTPLCSLAETLSDMGKSKDAIPFVEEALNLEPGKSFVIAAASKVYYDVGNVDTALQIILEGLRISPNDTRLHHRAGMILKNARMFPKAKEHLEQASKDPALSYSVIALADVYLELGQINEADEIIEKYPGNKQKSPAYLTTKANILRRQNDFKNAEILLQKAIRVQPSDIMPYGLMATVKLEKGKLQLSKGEKEVSRISFLEAKKYISDGLAIDSKDESLLSVQHELGKYN